jgi:membrane-bound lytic murein transglycosylase D
MARVTLILAVSLIAGCMKPVKLATDVDAEGLVFVPTTRAAPSRAPGPQVFEGPSAPSGVTPVTQADAAEPPPIWERLRRGFGLPVVEHPRVEREIARLRASPLAVYNLLEAGQPYLHHVLDAVERAGLPTELALLPAVESGFRPDAVSRNGAAGLWQFMPPTGEMLGLYQDWWFDRRLTVRQSTRAAVTYLDLLEQRFDGDWLHALAAYNAGSGTVGRAIRRAGQRGADTDYWSLDLPAETDAYVPRLLALSRIVADPAAFGLVLPDIPDRPYFAMVEAGSQIDLRVAAEIAGIGLAELYALNAGNRRWATPPDGPHVLLLPVASVQTFTQGLATLPEDERLRYRRYQIKPGDSLSVIARRHDVSIQVIQQANGLQGNRIQAGRHLVIPSGDGLPSSLQRSALAGERTVYRVRRGDSLYTIAQRFRVSIADLKRWNQVGEYIRPGDRLTLFVDPDA